MPMPSNEPTLRLSRERIRHESFARKLVEERLRKEDRRDAPSARRQRRPGNGGPITGRPAAEQRCHTFKIVVRAVRIREKACGQKKQRNHGILETSFGFAYAHL